MHNRDSHRGEVAEPGLRRTPGTRLDSKGSRGFESHLSCGQSVQPVASRESQSKASSAPPSSLSDFGHLGESWETLIALRASERPVIRQTQQTFMFFSIRNPPSIHRIRATLRRGPKAFALSILLAVLCEWETLPGGGKLAQ
jgi:hypothetical protein